MSVGVWKGGLGGASGKVKEDRQTTSTEAIRRRRRPMLTSKQRMGYI